jgi:sec-independent protein translocase protein TatA
LALGMPNMFELIIVLVIVLVLFGGKGKLSSLMGDLAQGIQSFRKGLKDGEDHGGAARLADGHTVDVTPEHKVETPRTEA